MIRTLAVVAAVWGGATGATYVFLVEPVEARVHAGLEQQVLLGRHVAELQDIAQNLNERRREQDEVRRANGPAVRAVLGKDLPPGVSAVKVRRLK